MFRAGAFEVEGIIIEVLSDKTCRAELINGHRLLAFIAGKVEGGHVLAVGEKVKLQLSPYDLSEGRILLEQQRIRKT